MTEPTSGTYGVTGADAPQEFFCNKCGYFGPVQVFHERPNGSGKCDYMAVPMKASESRCKVPPPGWSCSREPGHEGPCAARPVGVTGTLKPWEIPGPNQPNPPLPRDLDPTVQLSEGDSTDGMGEVDRG